MNSRSLIIQFDEAWAPTVFINGETDLETAKLREIVERMLASIERPDDD